MSTGRTAPRRTRRRNQNRGKWIIAALMLLALVGLVLARNAWQRPLANNEPAVAVLDGVSETVGNAQASASDAADAVAGAASDALDTTSGGGENALGVNADEGVDSAENASAIPVTISEPLVTRAVVGYDADGNEMLTISGSGDERCQLIRFMLDGDEVGTTAPDPDGSWALTLTSVPPVGTYMSEIECEVDNSIYTAAPRALELRPPATPEPTVAAADASQALIESPSAVETAQAEAANQPENPEDIAADPATNPDDNQANADLSDEGAGNDSAEAEASEPVEQPTFFLAQDMGKYVGGPILLRGDTQPNAVVEIVFDNGTTQIIDTARADDAGDWRYRGALFDPGVYRVTAQLAGTSAEPSQQVNVPAGTVFGAKGDCVGKTPPFGTVNDDTYTVNYCEYFSLIADRLGVTFGELQAANPQLTNLDYLTQGDILNIPPTP